MVKKVITFIVRENIVVGTIDASLADSDLFLGESITCSGTVRNQNGTALGGITLFLRVKDGGGAIYHTGTIAVIADGTFAFDLAIQSGMAGTWTLELADNAGFTATI